MHIPDCHNRPERKLLHWAKKASELKDLLSCHHRADGKGAHMPVGDILKEESREGVLRQPSFNLHMLD